MQSQRETTTDCLADVIQVSQIGGRSGTLTVERGRDGNLEEGFIAFIQGRVVDVKVNQQRGLPAFNYLSIWQFCRYAFIDHTSNHPSAFPPVLSPESFSGSTSAMHSPSSRATEPLGHMNRTEPLNGVDGRLSCPLRLRAGEALLLRPGNVSLSRPHRHLLLLINGQRSVCELARLLVRNPDEVQRLLEDLNRMGLIRQ